MMLDHDLTLWTGISHSRQDFLFFSSCPFLFWEYFVPISFHYSHLHLFHPSLYVGYSPWIRKLSDFKPSTSWEPLLWWSPHPKALPYNEIRGSLNSKLLKNQSQHLPTKSKYLPHSDSNFKQCYERLQKSHS